MAQYEKLFPLSYFGGLPPLASLSCLLPKRCLFYSRLKLFIGTRYPLVARIPAECWVFVKISQVCLNLATNQETLRRHLKNNKVVLLVDAHSCCCSTLGNNWHRIIYYNAIYFSTLTILSISLLVHLLNSQSRSFFTCPSLSLSPFSWNSNIDSCNRWQTDKNKQYKANHYSILLFLSCYPIYLFILLS